MTKIEMLKESIIPLWKSNQVIQMKQLKLQKVRIIFYAHFVANKVCYREIILAILVWGTDWPL